MKNSVILNILGLLLLISCQQHDHSHDHDEQALKNEGLQVDHRYSLQQIRATPSVKIGPLERRSIERTIHCTGAIEVPPTDLISIHPMTSGVIRDLRFVPGDAVVRGDVICALEHPSIVELQQLLLETDARLELAEKKYERAKKLYEQQASTSVELEEAKSAQNELKATFGGLKKRLSLIGVNVDGLLEGGEINTRVYLRAPAAGHIQRVNVHQGQMVMPEQSVMTIAGDDHMHLELQVLAKDVGLIEIGQKVEYFLPNNNRVYHAEVVKINPMLDADRATLQIHCHIEESERRTVRPGMFVNANIEVSKREVFGLNRNAVVKAGDAYYAFVVDGDMVERIPLTGVEAIRDFVVFDSIPYKEVVSSGAYYIGSKDLEAGHSH